jgi:Phage P22-like portal protein
MDLKFLAGDQWPEFARQARANRPMLTINKLPQFLHQVTNDIRRNAAVIKVTPVDGKQDPAMAAVYDGIINDIQYRSSAKHIYATAAYHAAACGIGHWRVVSKYCDDDTFDQELSLELIPYPLAVYWDPAAVKPDRSDAMWCIVVEIVPRATFELKYPGMMPTSVTDYRAGDTTAGVFWVTADYVLIAEYWAKVPITRTLVAFQGGQTVDITGKDMAELADLQMQFGPVVQKRTRPGYAVEQTMVTGSDILSGPHRWPGKHIPIVPVIGNEVPLERNTVRSGLIRHARDAQQLYNFYRSAAAESIALAPKAPFLATTKQIGKHKEQWDTANTANAPYLLYEPDDKAPGLAPNRVHPPEPPEALWREAQVATEDLKATTGIYDASLGAKSNETSGIAIKRREQQGDTANYHYQDNLQRSIEHGGRIIVDLIPKIYDNQRVIRLLAVDGKEQFVPINHQIMAEDGEPVLINDLSVGRYDVRVTIGPSYDTKRLEGASAITELMSSLPPEFAAALADIAVRNMDIPDAEEAAQRIRNMLPPQALTDPNAAPPNPLDDPMARAELATRFAMARKTTAEANKIAIETAAQFGVMAPPAPLPLPPEAEPEPQPDQMPPEMMGGEPMPSGSADGGPPLPMRQDVPAGQPAPF